MQIQRYDKSSFIVVVHQGSDGDDTTYLRKNGTVAPCVEDDETDGYWGTYAEAEQLARAYARAHRRARDRARRQAVKDVMDSFGLVKVRGALGGTYYE
jgi:hypothetical protein